MKVEQQANKREYTHFVAIKLASPLLTEAIEQYCNSISQGERFAQYVQDARKTHFTLLMLNLPEDKLIEKAQQVLKKIRPKVVALLKNEQSKISLKGANFFGKNAEEARVVYLEIEKRDGYEFVKSLADLVIKTFL